MALQVPLDDMPFIYAQVEKAIGKIILAHPTDADPQRPALVNARFDLKLEARPNMKDVLWVETTKGDVLEIKLACSDSLKCRSCRQFFHTEQDCKKGGGARPRETGTVQSEQIHRQQQGPTTLSNGGNQVSGYHGPMGPRPGTPRQPSGVHARQLRVNPTFSPQGGGGGQQRGHGPLNGQYQARGIPPLDGQGGTGQTRGGLSAQMGQMLGGMNMGGGEGGTCFAQPQGVHPMPWQGGVTSEWLLANGIHPALWMGMMGGQGTTPMMYQQGTQAGQQGASGVGAVISQALQQQQPEVRIPIRPFPLFGGTQARGMANKGQSSQSGAKT
ncbi:hypothetical protein CBR_g128 [Chara braunii]|uniref:Uncharacterized protein n=1 Tax=Chara braunii TaxID=69332 RepID=A0A388JLP7_CHABU|nr:hypothetical protein CBR_g128 [Chara braunii]|eukprot:GBG58727.1 hypothetical protein CBR_g128 [Chara braunii]